MKELYSIEIPKDSKNVVIETTLEKITKVYEYLCDCIIREEFEAWWTECGVLAKDVIGNYTYKTLSVKDLKVYKMILDDTQITSKEDITKTMKKPKPYGSNNFYQEYQIPIDCSSRIGKKFFGYIDLEKNVVIDASNVSEYVGKCYIDFNEKTLESLGIITSDGEKLPFTPHVYDEVERKGVGYFRIIKYLGDTLETDTISKDILRNGKACSFGAGIRRPIIYKGGGDFTVSFGHKFPDVHCKNMKDVEEVLRAVIKSKKKFDYQFSFDLFKTDTISAQVDYETGGRAYITKRVDPKDLESLRENTTKLFMGN